MNKEIAESLTGAQEALTAAQDQTPTPSGTGPTQTELSSEPSLEPTDAGAEFATPPAQTGTELTPAPQGAAPAPENLTHTEPHDSGWWEEQEELAEALVADVVGQEKSWVDWGLRAGNSKTKNVMPLCILLDRLEASARSMITAGIIRQMTEEQAERVF